MKTFLSLALLVVGASAFSPLASQPKSRVFALKMVYVPDGMTPQQWNKLKNKEKQAKSKKNFGAIGPQSFKSRSLQSFQEDMEKGKANHLMPVMFAKDRVKKGEIKQEDIPYMQRLGSWDNSDVKGAKKAKWSKTDEKYEKGVGHFASMTDKTAKKPSISQGKPEKKGLFGGLFP